MTSVKRAKYTVEQFGGDVSRLLDARGEIPESIYVIGGWLQRLIEDGGDLWARREPSFGSSGLEGRILYKEPQGKFRLVLSQFAPDKPTSVHSHHRWGVLCGYRGKERYTVWERIDDGSQPGRAQLQSVADHTIERGDLGFWFNPPYNIHRQWAKGDQPSAVLILMGGDPSRKHIFDLEHGTYREVAANAPAG